MTRTRASRASRSTPTSFLRLLEVLQSSPASSACYSAALSSTPDIRGSHASNAVDGPAPRLDSHRSNATPCHAHSLWCEPSPVVDQVRSRSSGVSKNTNCFGVQAPCLTSKRHGVSNNANSSLCDDALAWHRSSNDRNHSFPFDRSLVAPAGASTLERLEAVTISVPFVKLLEVLHDSFKHHRRH